MSQANRKNIMMILSYTSDSVARLPFHITAITVCDVCL